ncbi:carboxypeptidase regulatory-like domain-containing protein [bacterium]|nr:carboxypeptidase regulatory-like domain-containing protein [bacterium]
MLKRISVVISFCFLSMLIHSINVYCQSGNISGTVTDNSGVPVQNAEVFVYGSDIGDISDADGHYQLSGVTCGSPRYIVCAIKEGYVTGMKGEIDVPSEGAAMVDFTLQEENADNTHRSQFFEVKMCYLIDHPIVTSDVIQPREDALLDTLLYPDSIKVYMRAGKHIDPTDPVIAGIANEILLSIPDSLRTHQTEVARRVYIWVVTHIHYDLMKNYPGDLTCGNWQTVNGGWGHNFNDWCYEPAEVVAQERAICIEFERLASALLRALYIPARPAPLKAHPVTQWWVQPPDSAGYWANMETSGGSGEYWANGDSLAKFPSRQEHEIAFWWQNADAPIQNNWNSGYNHLWQETGGSTRLERSASGLAVAQTMLAEFEQYGRFISSGPRPIPDQPDYEVYIKGSNMDLSTMETGQEITYWFPIFQTSRYNEVLQTAVWTSHPEWVIAQWVETLSDPIYGKSIDLQYISFYLQSLTEKADNLLNAGFEEGSDDPFQWAEFMVSPGSAVLDRSSISHNGGYSAHISGNQQQTIASYRQTLPITPGDHVRINGWIKTQNLNGNATLEIIFNGDGLDNPPPFPQVKPNISGTHGWTWVNGGATAPQGAERVTIGCTLFGQGEAWFDDIQLTVWNSDNITPDRPPIYVSIITHNEEPSSRPGGYPDFVNNESAFWQHRESLIEFASMLHAEGVKYNYQSDWNFLLAATKYDTGAASTNSKNFLRYLKEDLGFEIDPHAHETQYNYADVAYLIEELGVPVSQTTGGFLAFPPESSKLEYFRQPITGSIYSDYTWQAEILWGGATLFHQNEDSLWISGIWKPQDNEHFLTHDENAPLPEVGGYRNNWQGLNKLLQKQQNGELEEGKIYTQTIFAGQNSMLNPQFIQDFQQQIQALSEYTRAGLIQWVGLAEVIDIWESQYNSEPNLLPFLEDTFSIPFEDSRFGIFGAYVLEYRWFMQQMGFDENDYWNWVDGHFENLATHWTRSNTQLIWELIEPDLDGNYNWDIITNPDGVITNVYDSPAGVNMLGCIHVGEGPDGFRNPLEHPTAWQNFLKAAVERYNGDGDNDINEFVHLKYWQIGNEIFPLTNADVSPEQYAQIVSISEQAIHTVDPAAKICLIAPTQGFSIDTFLQQTIIELSNLQVEFDVLDIHHWGKADNYKMTAVPMYRTFLNDYGCNNVEIWSCEHGTWCYQPDNEPFQTKDEQSESLIKRYLWNFANGLDKLFWNNLMEWHGFKDNPGSIFNSQGLIGDGSFCSEPTEELNHLRKSYFCYKKLAENIDFDKAELVGENSFHDELNGNYGYTFKDLKTNENFYFVWTELESAVYSFSINSEYEWINLIPVNDNGDFDTQRLSAGNHEITIGSGTVFLLKKRTITSVIEESQMVTEYELCQNYPNPFNPQTTISYQLPICNKVSLKVYDILGQEVRTLVNENKSAGCHSVVWDGRDNLGSYVCSGVYFYYLKAGDEFSQTKKLLLIK